VEDVRSTRSSPGERREASSSRPTNGVDPGFRDASGNHFRMTEPTRGG
jgi:hypothetical protein